MNNTNQIIGCMMLSIIIGIFHYKRLEAHDNDVRERSKQTLWLYHLWHDTEFTLYGLYIILVGYLCILYYKSNEIDNFSTAFAHYGASLLFDILGFIAATKAIDFLFKIYGYPTWSKLKLVAYDISVAIIRVFIFFFSASIIVDIGWLIWISLKY